MRIAGIIAVLAATACSNDPTAPLDRAFTLDVGQTVSVDDAELSIKFVRVTEDSRCPSNVQCVWAGNGQIEIEARDDAQPNSLALNTMEGAKEVVVGQYRIQLLALDPAPVAGQPIPANNYRATLKVTRGGLACTEEARPALMVGLTDSLSGATTGFTGVTIVATEGAYADSIVMPVYPADPYNGPVALAYERRGTYTVSVRANGYVTWTRSGVVVSGDQCHVTTVSLTARLVR
jgi:hypothetical protein